MDLKMFGIKTDFEKLKNFANQKDFRFYWQQYLKIVMILEKTTKSARPKWEKFFWRSKNIWNLMTFVKNRRRYL